MIGAAGRCFDTSLAVMPFAHAECDDGTFAPVAAAADEADRQTASLETQTSIVSRGPPDEGRPVSTSAARTIRSITCTTSTG